MKFTGMILLCLALSAALFGCGGKDAETSDGHTHEYESEVLAQPGCEETGVIRYTCSCGDGYEENVDATGHDFVIDEVVSPTFFSEGYTIYKCTRCGATEQRDPTPAVTGSIELPDIPL